MYRAPFSPHQAQNGQKKNSVSGLEIQSSATFTKHQPFINLWDFVQNENVPTTRYEILRPHQLPIVHQLLYESFFVDEPMTRHLGLCQVWLTLFQNIICLPYGKVILKASRALTQWRTGTWWWKILWTTTTSLFWQLTGKWEYLKSYFHKKKTLLEHFSLYIHNF